MGVVSHLPMHRRAFIPTRIFALSLLALGGMGCGQAEGERCQVDSDCKSGLTCQDTSGPLYAVNGVCKSTSSAGTPDASTTSDASTRVAPDSALKFDTPPRDIAPDLVSKVDTQTDTTETKADVPQVNDAGVDAPQITDAPVDALRTADASDGRID
jgi:hypothetical protein